MKRSRPVPSAVDVPTLPYTSQMRGDVDSEVAPPILPIRVDCIHISECLDDPRLWFEIGDTALERFEAYVYL
jgi:hypothetical protein